VAAQFPRLTPDRRHSVPSLCVSTL